MLPSRASPTHSFLLHLHERDHALLVRLAEKRRTSRSDILRQALRDFAGKRTARNADRSLRASS